jgi:hypothetical protein
MKIKLKFKSKRQTYMTETLIWKQAEMYSFYHFYFKGLSLRNNERNWDNPKQQFFIFLCDKRPTEMLQVIASRSLWLCCFFIEVVCCNFWRKNDLWNCISSGVWNLVGGVTVFRMTILLISKDHLLPEVWPLNNLFEGELVNWN